MQTPDGYWRVEIHRKPMSTEHWYRVVHATTVLADRAALATVQHILGEAFADLVPVDAEPDEVA